MAKAKTVVPQFTFTARLQLTNSEIFGILETALEHLIVAQKKLVTEYMSQQPAAWQHFLKTLSDEHLQHLFIQFWLIPISGGHATEFLEDAFMRDSKVVKHVNAYFKVTHGKAVQDFVMNRIAKMATYAKNDGDDEDHAYLMKRAKSLGYKAPKP